MAPAAVATVSSSSAIGCWPDAFLTDLRPPAGGSAATIGSLAGSAIDQPAFSPVQVSSELVFRVRGPGTAEVPTSEPARFRRVFQQTTLHLWPAPPLAGSWAYQLPEDVDELEQGPSGATTFLQACLRPTFTSAGSAASAPTNRDDLIRSLIGSQAIEGIVVPPGVAARAVDKALRSPRLDLG